LISYCCHCFLLLVWHCCSSIVCMMLMPIVQCCYSSCFCSMLLLLLSLLDVFAPLVLAWRFCSFYFYSTLIFFLCLFNVVVPLTAFLVLAQHCCFSCLCPRLLYLSSCSMLFSLSLFNIVALLLLAQLYCSYVLVWHCYSSSFGQHYGSYAPCSMLLFPFFLFILDMACSHLGTFLLPLDVATPLFLVLCSMLLHVFLTFEISTFPF
jgi:hypothetical protein